MKVQIKKELMKIYDQEASVDEVADNLSVLFGVSSCFSIDDPIIVKASLDIRSEYVGSNPLRKPEQTDRQLKGYLVELLNSLNN